MAQTGFQYHFWLFLFLWQGAAGLEGGIAGQAGGAVKSTFCGGWVGGQEDTLRPGPGLPRGHLDGGNTRRVPGQTWSSTLTHTIALARTYTPTHVYTHTAHVARLGTDTWLRQRSCIHACARTLKKKKTNPDTAAAVKQGCKCEAAYMACKMIFVHDAYYQEHISRLYPASNSHSNPHMPSTQHSSVYGDVNVKLPADECFTFG